MTKNPNNLYIEGVSKLKPDQNLFYQNVKFSLIVFLVGVASIVGANFLNQNQKRSILVSSPKPQTSQTRPTLNDKGVVPSYVEGEVLVKLRQPLSLRSAYKTSFSQRAFSVGKEVELTNLDMDAFSANFKRTLADLSVSYVAKAIKTANLAESSNFDFKTNIASAGFDKIYKFKFSQQTPVNLAVSKLNQNSEVEYATPNYIFKTTLIPNDPYFLDSYPDQTSNRVPNYKPPFDYQWNLKVIKTDKAWDRLIKSPMRKKVKIAIVDSGIDYTHPELGGCSLEQVNKQKCPLILPGYNFVNGNRDPMDKIGHGTFIAGIIAAHTGNTKGMAGMMWFGGKKIKLMPVKIFGKQGWTSLEMIASGVVYAAGAGVDIINMSFGTTSPIADIPVMREVLDYADYRGVVLVAAAGNSGKDLAGYWPATYSKVISVGSTNYKNELSSYSNHGYGMDLVAPGESILSLRASGTDMYCLGRSKCDSGRIVNNDYYFANGTSFAAPEVVAATAMIWLNQPTLTNLEIRQVLRSGAKDLGAPGPDSRFGAGLLDVAKSMAFTKDNLPPTAMINSPSSFVILSPSKQHPLVVGGTATGKNFDYYKIMVAAESDNPKWTTKGVSLMHSGRKPVVNRTLGWVDVSNLKTGSYLLRLVVYNKDRVSSSWQAGFAVDRDILSGFPRNVNSPVRTSPVVADLNHDGRNEIIIAAADGKIHVFNPKGDYLQGWPKKLSKGVFYRLPAVADVNGDGYDEIILVSQQDKKVYILNYKGQVINSYTTKSRYSTPVIGSFLNKDEKEILIWDHDRGAVEIYNDKKPLLVQRLIDGDSINNPAIVDVNGDGYDEIVATGQRYGFEKIFVFQFDKKLKQYKTLSSAPLNYQRSCSPFLTAPSIADIDDDGLPEAVVTCGSTVNLFKKTDTNHILAFDLSSKNIKLKWDYIQNVNGYRSLGNFNPPALIDINRRSGGLEVLSSTSLFKLTDKGMKIRLGLFELSSNGKLDRFIDYKNLLSFGVISDFPVQAPITANMDEDSEAEIVIPVPNNHTNPVGRSLLLAFNRDGTPVKNWPKLVETEVYGTPVFADVTGNGYNEVIAVSLGGYVYVWRTKGYDRVANSVWPQKYYNNLRTSSAKIKPNTIPLPTPTSNLSPTPTYIPTPSRYPSSSPTSTPSPIPEPQPIIKIPDSIVFQAEEYSYLSNKARSVIKTKLSKQTSLYKYLEINQAAGKNYGGDSNVYAVYDLRAIKAGWYTLWMRNNWPDWSSNSVYVQLDNQKPFAYHFYANQNKWNWKKGSRIYLTKGQHKLAIKNRESGVKLDVIVLTLNNSFNPADYNWYIGYMRRHQPKPTSASTPVPTATPKPPSSQPIPVSGGYWYQFEMCKAAKPLCQATGINLLNSDQYQNQQAIEFDAKLANSYAYNPDSDKKLEYVVSTPQAGKAIYYLWLLRKAPNYSSDSVFITIDGEYKTTLHFSGAKNKLEWQKVALSFPAGESHTLGFVMRESGAIFDSFVLTSDKNFVPSY